MRGITEYIVAFEKTHKDDLKIDGVDYNMNPFFNQPKQINRIGTIVSAPYYGENDLKPGTQVMVIHIGLIQETLRNGRAVSPLCVDHEKNWFRLAPNQIVMYRKNKDEDWKCYLDSLMVMPIRVAEKMKTWNGYDIPESVFENGMGYKGNEKQMGVIAYDNDNLIENGLFKGDTVLFKLDREYEFEIDGKIYYHMSNDCLLMAKSNFIKTEEELSDVFA